jgi:hypothetical protein
MEEKFLMSNIPMRAKCLTGTITGKVSISINKMFMEFNNSELEELIQAIINDEIRTPENTAYFKELMLEVLIEQGLIKK